MSDLQCAARLIIARAPAETQQSRELADSLAGHRIAGIWTSPSGRAVQCAEAAATRLGATVVVRDELAQAEPGEQDEGVVDRVRTVLEEAADLYRGESLLVVTHGGVIDQVVPLLAANLRHEHVVGAPLPPGGVVELDGDADGWVVRSWAGKSLA